MPEGPSRALRRQHPRPPPWPSSAAGSASRHHLPGRRAPAAAAARAATASWSPRIRRRWPSSSSTARLDLWFSDASPRDRVANASSLPSARSRPPSCAAPTARCTKSSRAIRVGLALGRRAPSRVASTRTLTRASSSLSSLLPGQTWRPQHHRPRGQGAHQVRPLQAAPRPLAQHAGDTPRRRGCAATSATSRGRPPRRARSVRLATARFPPSARLDPMPPALASREAIGARSAIARERGPNRPDPIAFFARARGGLRARARTSSEARLKDTIFPDD